MSLTGKANYRNLKAHLFKNIIKTSAYHDITKYHRINAELICASLKRFYV